METREPSGAIAAIAADLVSTDPRLAGIRGSSVRICYLESDREKTSNGRLVYGECEKVPPKWQWAVPYDFAVTVYAPNTERFTEGQMRILMLHELMHVGVSRDGNEETYCIVPHDVEDFRAILDEYGMGWSQ